VTFEREFNQAIDESGIRQTGVRPHFRVHANGGESRYRIDFIDVKFPGRRFTQEIDAPHTFAAHGLVAGDGEAADFGEFGFREFGGKNGLRQIQFVLVLIVIKLPGWQDLARRRRFRIRVAEYRAFEFTALDTPFDNDLAVLQK
jgi:hypothetical protein